MTSKPPGSFEPAPFAGEAELRAFGITRVAADQFQVGPYRYSNLADAIAQAKRGPAAGNDL